MNAELLTQIFVDVEMAAMRLCAHSTSINAAFDPAH